MAVLADSQLILKSLTLASSDEVYMLDATSMRLLYASEKAREQLKTDALDVTPVALELALGISLHALAAHVDQHREKESQFEISASPALSRDYPYNSQLRVILIQSAGREYLLITKSDLSPNEQTILALSESDARFQAIVANMPGLVFQIRISEDHTFSFHYVSDGCEALLGITAAELLEDADLMFSIMNARDRMDLRSKLITSAETLQKLDWEGRVWIDGWQDTKWVNIRATTTLLKNGVVQWDGIMLNITQSKLEKQEIEQSRRDMEQMNAHMNQVKEQERVAIAREIHDDLGGNLTAIKMGLTGIASQALAGQMVSIEQTQQLESIVDRTFEAVHRISGNLRPSIIDLGIVDAIEWQLNQFKKQVGLTCHFNCNQSEILLSTDQCVALFRICQESLSNIAKYAKATQVNVELIEEHDQLTLLIMDNGVGIHDADKLKMNSFGLRGMQERVSGIHGRLHIGHNTQAGSGTKIEVTIPL